MVERPILFSAPMVRAILEGRKTQTRRTVEWPDWVKDRERAAAELDAIGRTGGHPAFGDFKDGRVVRHFKCRYGGRGDRLWVRETHCTIGVGPDTCVAYRASCPNDEFDFVYADGAISRVEVERWRPAIHMKREHSRITLEVTGVRVERLQDISEEDATAEGVDLAAVVDLLGGPGVDASIVAALHRGARDLFRVGWGCINGADSWDANPWVWVVEFTAVPR